MKRYSRWLNALFKIGVVVLLGLTLYQEIGTRQSAASLWDAFRSGIQGQLWPLAFVILLLMWVNWVLETLKWRVFTKAFFRSTFRQSLEGVLAGVTLSLITPQRLGDYGGRLLRVPAPYKWQAVSATVMSNLCQLIVLLGAGALGLGYFTAHYWPEGWKAAGDWFPLMIGLPLLLLAGLSFLRPLGRRILRLPALRRFRELGRQLRSLDGPTLMKGLGLAALRYATYSTQYYLLLYLFGIAPSAEAAFAGIATIFFIQSSVPLPPLLGLLARGEIALLVWGVFDANEFSILAATLSLFIINLFIPALLGLVIVVKTDVLKPFSYENNYEQNRAIDDPRGTSDGFRHS